MGQAQVEVKQQRSESLGQVQEKDITQGMNAQYGIKHNESRKQKTRQRQPKTSALLLKPNK